VSHPATKENRKIEQGIRNQVEGKFGQGKNGYNFNKVRARTSRTSESSFLIGYWISEYSSNINP
jgi:hypothetical protein